MPTLLNTKGKIHAETVKVCGQIVEACRLPFTKAIRVGELLTLAKPHYPKAFEQYLETLPISKATARNYMKLFENRETLESLAIRDLTSAYDWLYPNSVKSKPQEAKADKVTNKESTVKVVDEAPLPPVNGDDASAVSVLQAKVTKVTISQVSKLMESWSVDCDTAVKKAIAYTFKHRGEVNVNEDDSVDSDGAAGMDVSSDRPLTGPAAFHAARKRAGADKGQQTKRRAAVGANSKRPELVAV